MPELKNEFSWSKSRDETFRECPRKYFFQYYGTWGGWDVRADERTRKLYTLKQLQSRHVWAGSKVHDCIKTPLQNLRRGIEPMTEGEAIETTLAVMREEFSNSRRGGYWDDPKSCGLFKHEYGIRLAHSKWKETPTVRASFDRECPCTLGSLPSQLPLLKCHTEAMLAAMSAERDVCA